MDCRITCSRRAARGAEAFTLVEAWVSMGLVGIMMVAVVSFTMYTGRSFAGVHNYIDLEQATQKALDTMTSEIRQTLRLKSISTNQLVFSDFDGVDLSYTYNARAGTLVRTKNGLDTTLLRSCDLLMFSNYQRTPVPQSDGQYPVTQYPTNTKLVSVTWICSRTITGTKINTESVQTAKIVLRNQ